MFLGADNYETAELIVPMHSIDDYAEKIKDYRVKNHVTQQELAQLMGVKHFYTSQLGTKTSKATLSYMAALQTLI